MDLFVIVYLVYNVVIVLSIERLMGVFFENRRTHIALFVLSFLLYYALSSFAFLMWNIPAITLAINFITYIIITLNYKSQMLKRLAAVIGIYFVALVVDILTYLIIMSGRLMFFEYVGFRHIELFVLNGVLIYFIAVISRRMKNIRKTIQQPSIHHAAYAVIPLASIFIALLIFSQAYLSDTTILLTIIVVCKVQNSNKTELMFCHHKT